MRNDEKFLELLQSLENDRYLFQNGILHSQKEFIDNIHRLRSFIPQICNDKIRDKVEKFVNSVIKHKNYKIYLEAENQKKKRLQKQKDCQQREQERLNRNSLRVINALEINNKISSAQNNEDLKNVIEFFLIKKNESDWLKMLNLNVLKKMKITKVIYEKKIEKLIHFTNVNNLESILEFGIIPRETLENDNIKFEHTDSERRENKKNCTSLSIEYPNFYMLSFKKRKHSAVYVILVLNAISILLNDTRKYYVYKNAASSNVQDWIEKLVEPRYFRNMFQDDFFYYKRNSCLPSYIPTDPQAEILVNGIIPSNDILEIHFETNDDYNTFISNVKNKEILNNFSCVVSDFYFASDRANINWDKR